MLQATKGETTLRDARRHLPLQPWGEPFKGSAPGASQTGRRPGNVTELRRNFRALTQASNECKSGHTSPPPYGYWGPFGPLCLPEIEEQTRNLQENAKK